MNGQLLAHPAFVLFLYNQAGECDDIIAYVLQNKYGFNDLDQHGFYGMARNGILKGKDMEFWNICKYFEWSAN